MSLVRLRSTGDVITMTEFARRHPDTHFGATLTSFDFDFYKFDLVTIVPQPDVTEYEEVEYLGVVQQADGSYAQSWKVVPKSAEAIAAIDEAKAASVRDEAKRNRQAAVDAIVVSVGEKTFDGDEISQGRMARAILALRAANKPTTLWTLATNEQVEVSTEELEQALILAGQAQTDLWNIV